MAELEGSSLLCLSTYILKRSISQMEAVYPYCFPYVEDNVWFRFKKTGPLELLNMIKNQIILTIVYNID